ncbi:MAG: hypothetical protein JNJ77_16680 [Planctomycetia bacterium]|nr:hypothetical protein [Planctomycetia bacterium]
MLFILLLLAVTFTRDDLPEGWNKVSLPTAGFKVNMPNPERKFMEDKGPDDKPVFIRMHRGKEGKVSYLVTVSEFSLSYISQPAKTIFDNAREGSLARSGGSLVSEKDIKLDKVPGREFVVKAKEAGFVRARVYVFNQRQYSVMVAGPKLEDLETPETKQFFDSFKLTPIRKQGK